MKVGDKVTIRKNSKYYGRDKGNPAGTVGEIQSILMGGEMITVMWNDRLSNIYNDFDLDVVGNLPDMPKDTEIEMKCDCDSRDVFNLGCKCLAGRLELDKERT